MQEAIVIIAVCLTVSFALTELFRRFKYPELIAPIIGGIILGLPPIRDMIFQGSAIELVGILSEMGIIFLLLLAGLEIDYPNIRRTSSEIIVVSIFSTIVPLILGYVMSRTLGYSPAISIIIGACLAVTAEAVNLKVLLDMGYLNTRLGRIMIGSAILDNVIEFMLLGGVVLLIHQGAKAALLMLPLRILYFLVIIYIVFTVIHRLASKIRLQYSEMSEFTLTIILGLIIAIVSNLFGIGPIIGAFIAGSILQLALSDKQIEARIIHDLKLVTFGLIVPFFFINIGLHIDFAVLLQNYWLVILIVFVAISGKVIGSMVLTPFSDMSFKQTALIGWAMNSRGSVELVIAEIGRVNGLLPIEIYSALIIMAVVTTFIFPFALKYYTGRYMNIME